MYRFPAMQSTTYLFLYLKCKCNCTITVYIIGAYWCISTIAIDIIGACWLKTKNNITLSGDFLNLIEKSQKQRQDIHDRSLSWLGIGTSIKSGGDKLVLQNKPPLITPTLTFYWMSCFVVLQRRSVMVLNSTFNSISIISLRSVLLVEGPGVPG